MCLYFSLSSFFSSTLSILFPEKYFPIASTFDFNSKFNTGHKSLLNCKYYNKMSTCARKKKAEKYLKND